MFNPIKLNTKAAVSLLALAISMPTLAANGLDESFAQEKARLDMRFNAQRPFEFSFSSTPLLVSDSAANGTAIFDFANSEINVTVNDLDAVELVDVWLLKNTPGAGKTSAPESDDLMIKVGELNFEGNAHRLITQVEAEVLEFDFDMIVITNRNEVPSNTALATGSKTLFEKRFFREKFNIENNEVIAGTDQIIAETDDALVKLGADLFFNETFDGNSRTCGTCHRAENNLTIDPAFIATLDNDDPLFVAEFNGNLSLLEKPEMMREFGLILENVDGLEDPENKFVLRSVNHTFAMTNSMHLSSVDFQAENNPDQRTGWSGDGAPGRGTLNEFTIGAVNQHLTNDLGRIAGVDYRIPTQQELDAIEAFQLFSGRQSDPDMQQLTFRDASIENGRQVFSGGCNACHVDGAAGDNTFGNLLFDTGVNQRPETLAMNLPTDNGFKEGQAIDLSTTNAFNVPPVIEAADTGPFFHNNSAQTIEDVVDHYRSDSFLNSPTGVQFNGFGFGIQLNTGTNAEDLANFLRAINAAENLRQTRKRFDFVRNNPELDSSNIINTAQADLQDVIEVLSAKSIYPEVSNQAQLVLDILPIASTLTGNDKVAYFDHMISILNVSKEYLFLNNTLDQF